MNLDVSQIDRRGATLIAGMTLHQSMFEPRNKMQRQKTPPLAMIVCTICKHVAYSPVDLGEVDILVEGGLIFRRCHRCGVTTGWKHFEWHRPDWNKPLLYQTTQPDRV